jgi:hypothetical protein
MLNMEVEVKNGVFAKDFEAFGVRVRCSYLIYTYCEVNMCVDTLARVRCLLGFNMAMYESCLTQICLVVNCNS